MATPPKVWLTNVMPPKCHANTRPAAQNDAAELDNSQIVANKHHTAQHLATDDIHSAQNLASKRCTALNHVAGKQYTAFDMRLTNKIPLINVGTSSVR